MAKKKVKKTKKKRTPKQKGRHARRKGHQFEREVADLFKQHGFAKAQRQLEYQESECRGVDLEHTGRFAVQCKKLKQYASINTINEIQLEKDSDKIPVLITAGDNLKPMAVLPLENFMTLAGLVDGTTFEEAKFEVGDDFEDLESDDMLDNDPFNGEDEGYF